jgi:hypothetical protein
VIWEQITITLEVDSIYKQRFVTRSQPMELHWVVSNIYCDEVPMSKCVTIYEGELKVFSLKRIHFFEGAEMPDSLIQPYTIQNRLGWMRHRAIKWVMADRMILASLPSYQNVRFLFITNQREVESLVDYQIGYYKVYMRWIPHTV